MDKKKLTEETVNRTSGIFDKAEDLGEKLKTEYMKALNQLQKDAADFYIRYGAENSMSYADAVKYLSKVELRPWREKLEEYTKLIDEGDTDLLAEIKALDVKEKITRLESLMLDIRTELVKLGISEEEQLQLHLTDTFKESYLGAYAGIKGVVEAKASFAKIDPTVIEETIRFPWSGESFSEVIWGNTNKLARELKSELTQGFIKGTSVQKMSSNLAQKMDGGYKAALRVVRTESAHVLNKAALMSYADAGVTHVEFLAVLDSRTSAICFNLNGDIISLQDAVPGVNTPPLHPNCRSTILPVLHEVNDTGGEEIRSDIIGTRNTTDNAPTPMPSEKFERIKKGFARTGGQIIQTDAAEKLLKKYGADGATVNAKMIYLPKSPTTSAVFEELIHATQHRQGKYIKGDLENTILLEIEAQEKLIRNRKAYGIPNAETRVTIKNLRDYRNELKKLREGK